MSVTPDKVFTGISSAPLITEEVEIAEPELENKYKEGNKEVIVITGRNPKCPPGYKILKSNINDNKSDTNIIVCVKNIEIKPCYPDVQTSNNGLDWNDPLSLGISDTDYIGLAFPFNERDDDFVAGPINQNLVSFYQKQNGSFELWIGVLLIIIALIYLINSGRIGYSKTAPIKSKEISIEEVKT